MKPRYWLTVVLFALIGILCISAPLVAGQLEDGIAAFDGGDFETALRLLRPLAEQGNEVAQYGLGLMYYSGFGVPQNRTKAARWYRRAAEQDFVDAQYAIGVMYMFGFGVRRDLVQAYMWLSLVAARLSELDDQQEAQKEAQDALEDVHERLNRVAAEMTPQQIDEAQALTAEWKPKKQ